MRKAFHLFLFFDILFQMMHWLHLFDSFVAACPKQWLDGTEDFKNTGTIDNKKVLFDSFVAACPKQCSQPPAGKTEDSGESFCRCSLLVQLCLHRVLPKNTAENTALKYYTQKAAQKYYLQNTAHKIVHENTP